MPLQIIRQDITKIKCDAIVNPTNENMIPTGGTDLAIHNAAGGKLLEKCKKLGGCEVGKAKLTYGYDLPCKYVIHTVGPVWIDGSHNERELLESCYRECLNLARKKRCKSVAIPLISSGTYSYPKDKVLKVALDTVSEFLFENEMTVYIVVYDKNSYEISKSLFSDIQSFIWENEPVEKVIIDTFAEACEESAHRYTSRHFEVKPHSQTSSLGYFEPDTVAPVRKPTASASQKNLAAPVPFEDAAPAHSKAVQDKGKSLSDMLKEMDKSFSELLFYYIDLKQITDVMCYKKANVDKKTFSKIKCKKDYKPSKQTALSFAIALELNLEETVRLLQTVGMSLSNSNKFDIIVKYFIINGKYNIFEINETLFEFDQPLLGSL